MAPGEGVSIGHELPRIPRHQPEGFPNGQSLAKNLEKGNMPCFESSCLAAVWKGPPSVADELRQTIREDQPLGMANDCAKTFPKAESLDGVSD